MKTKLQFVFFAVLFFTSILTNSQTTTLLNEDFESDSIGSGGTWPQGYFGTYSNYPYNWFTVQNGGYPINNKTMQIIYIASSSSAFYGYGIQNAANTNFAPLIYKQINAVGYTNLKISYDWICNGEPFTDYGYLMMDNNLNLFFNYAGSYLQNASSVQHISNYLLTNSNQNFNLAWTFFSNQSNVFQPGLSIDNIIVTGEPILTAITTSASCAKSA